MRNFEPDTIPPVYVLCGDCVRLYGILDRARGADLAGWRKASLTFWRHIQESKHSALAAMRSYRAGL